ncbi:hypothetical protein BC332_29222 [Capsicum chinense]|nr:hypothetical protein BC332_29222 [Capsicum chinense]
MPVARTYLGLKIDGRLPGRLRSGGVWAGVVGETVWVVKHAKRQERTVFEQNQCAIAHGSRGEPGAQAYFGSKIDRGHPGRLKSGGVLCHTDILCSNGFPVPLFPRVLGHEGVGMIESVGENVTKLKEGDIVMTLYLGECNECPNCKSGRSNLCHKYPMRLSGLMLDGTSRMSIRGGQILYHGLSCSTWSEYAVINANYAVKVDPQQVPLPHTSLLCCGFTTGYGAAWREVCIEKGSTVAVLGLGAVGLGVVEGARSQGAGKIIGVDINNLRRGKGEAFGTTDFINPKEHEASISDMIKGITGGLGVDYVFECTGIPSMLNEAIEASKMGIGTIVVIGAGNGTSREFNLIPLMCGRTMKGSIYGGMRIHSDLPALLHRCANKVRTIFCSSFRDRLKRKT